ncbi:glycosyltransferase family 4 protein [Acinetobacter thermotolerans]|uniref:glycosyltransferase family 4 protein n=1 Tax=Acinetobacter thermotolerans TaxID=3151487 RepID=UPI00325B4AAA
MKKIKPAIWFPAIKTNTGTDKFTEQLVSALNQRGLRAEITWLPHHAEYLPWLVPVPPQPDWANIAHINTWLHPRFYPKNISLVATLHHCVQDKFFLPYKTVTQKIYHKFWITKIEKHCLKTADLVTTDSQYTAQCIKDIFGNYYAHVIYIGIDSKTFHPNELLRPFDKNKPFKLLFVGTNSIRKGFDLLPEIMQKLGEDFQLFYTSNAEQYEPLPKNMIQLPPQKTTQDLANTYRSMNALIFPSRLEGFGLVVAEAMASGLPVVIANSSALTELVTHCETGFLCEKDNISDFIQTIRSLKENPELCREVGKKARNIATTKFSIEEMVNQYIDHYTKLVNMEK